MTAKWNAAEFEDVYRLALKKLRSKAGAQTINFMDMLKVSVALASKRERRRHRSVTRKLARIIIRHTASRPAESDSLAAPK
jgi:hypothetical protein